MQGRKAEPISTKHIASHVRPRSNQLEETVMMRTQDKSSPIGEEPAHFYLNLANIQSATPPVTNSNRELNSHAFIHGNKLSKGLQRPYVAPRTTSKLASRDVYMINSTSNGALQKQEAPRIRKSMYVAVDTQDETVLLFAKNATEDEISGRHSDCGSHSLLHQNPPPPGVLPSKNPERKKLIALTKRTRQRKSQFENALEFQTTPARQTIDRKKLVAKNKTQLRHDISNQACRNVSKLDLYLYKQNSSEDYESGCKTPGHINITAPPCFVAKKVSENINGQCGEVLRANYGTNGVNTINQSQIRDRRDLQHNVPAGLSQAALPRLKSKISLSKSIEHQENYLDETPPVRIFASTDVHGDLEVEPNSFKFTGPAKTSSSSLFSSSISQTDYPAESRYLQNKLNNWESDEKHYDCKYKRNRQRAVLKVSKMRNVFSSDDSFSVGRTPYMLKDRLTSSPIDCSPVMRMKQPVYSLGRTKSRHTKRVTRKSSRLGHIAIVDYPQKSKSNHTRLRRRQPKKDLLNDHSHLRKNTAYTYYTNELYVKQNLAKQSEGYGHGDERVDRVHYTLKWINDINNIPHADKINPSNMSMCSDFAENVVSSLGKDEESHSDPSIKRIIHTYLEDTSKLDSIMQQYADMQNVNADHNTRMRQDEMHSGVCHNGTVPKGSTGGAVPEQHNYNYIGENDHIPRLKSKMNSPHYLNTKPKTPPKLDKNIKRANHVHADKTNDAHEEYNYLGENDNFPRLRSKMNSQHYVNTKSKSPPRLDNKTINRVDYVHAEKTNDAFEYIAKDNPKLNQYVQPDKEKHFTSPHEESGQSTPENFIDWERSCDHAIWQLSRNMHILSEDAKKIATSTANLLKNLGLDKDIEEIDLSIDSDVEEDTIKGHHMEHSAHQLNNFESNSETTFKLSDDLKCVERPTSISTMRSTDSLILKLINKENEEEEVDQERKALKMRVNQRFKFIEECIIADREKKRRARSHKIAMSVSVSKQRREDNQEIVEDQITTHGDRNTYKIENDQKGEFAQRTSKIEMQFSRIIQGMKLQLSEEFESQHVEICKIFSNVQRL